ncbi:stage III sporulation protein AE [Clostridium sp. Marseille-P299]|uniref:stage III sporulation protein AE n=1 Tax=Clostridium sp. Marseille-P299 TaxID=1805477 RepID=UPI0018D3F3C0|nr:stage III sporulation protein AE [Clostridium sp. Marseille-P299]
MILFIYLSLFLTEVKTVAANELAPEDLDYTEIQSVLDDVLSDDESMNFGTYVSELVSGKESISFGGILGKIKQVITSEILGNFRSLTKLITIAVIAAIFTNFSHTFQNSQVAETGFYVTYLLMFGILAATFMTATSLAANTLDKILDFMKALVPAYCMSVAFCTGASTSTLVYQGILVLITLVDIILIKIIIPLINLYMMAILANNLSKEDLLSKLADLLSTAIRWVLKTLLAVVIGIGTIQSLLAPAIDQMKRSAVIKATGSIPAIGGLLSGVTETVLGAGVLLKNSIGVAGMVAVIIICAIPLIKLVIYVFIYKLASAVIQPISDKRILNCVSASAEATSLLLQTVFVGAVLFEIVITIIAISTRGIV